MPIGNTYLPRKDADLDAWATNFDTLITATPTAYGLVSGQATAFHTLRQNFTNALATATNVSTRTKSTVAAKNAAKVLLLANARLLAAIVQATPTVTNSQKNDLELTVRDRFPTPIPAPVTRPIMKVAGTGSLEVDMRFSDETTPDSRSRPFGVIGCYIFAKAGTTPPGSIADCVFKGMATKNTVGPGSRAFPVTFDSGDVGKTAYILAQWVNRRGETGPVSSLVQSTIAA